MVEDPDPWLGLFAEAGCEAVIVHQEACRHLHRTLARTRSFGIRSGVALNPATPLSPSATCSTRWTCCWS